jgi:hypothetical protein
LSALRKIKGIVIEEGDKPYREGGRYCHEIGEEAEGSLESDGTDQAGGVHHKRLVRVVRGLQRIYGILL